MADSIVNIGLVFLAFCVMCVIVFGRMFREKGPK